MTDPAFEEIIQYRRRLRAKQEGSFPLRWGRLVQGAFTWHLTPEMEAPARSLCGHKLVEVGSQYQRPPASQVCGRCRRQVPWFFEG